MRAGHAGKSTGPELCLCESLPPVKTGYGVTGGQVCTGNQMFLSVELPPASLQK